MTENAEIQAAWDASQAACAAYMRPLIKGAPQRDYASELKEMFRLEEAYYSLLPTPKNGASRREAYCRVCAASGRHGVERTPTGERHNGWAETADRVFEEWRCPNGHPYEVEVPELRGFMCR